MPRQTAGDGIYARHQLTFAIRRVAADGCRSLHDMKKVLITGGAGFIGSHVVRGVLAAGADAVVVDNLLSGYRKNVTDLPITFVEGDVRDGALIVELARGCDAIIHLAASVGNTRSIEHPIDDSMINVIGTLHVLEAARRNGVRKVVFSSSAGIFGELKTLPIREDHPVEPDSPYGASKLGAEKLCLAYAKLYRMSCVCLRYFNVYGVNQRYDAYGNVIPIFAHRILNGAPVTIFGDGEQTRDFVNVKDVAAANLRAAMAQGASGAFNIASGTRISINALASMMYRLAKVEPRVQHGPPRKGDVRDSLADISAAATAFGYRPTVGLEEGLGEYLAWARTELVSA
jgi:UDP-glucose 4-epimerase